MNEGTTLSSVDVDDAERPTESTTQLWNSETLRDEGVELLDGQSPESPVGEISSDLPTTWEPMMEVTTEASPLSLSMEPQSAASDEVETESTTLMAERMTEDNETSPEVTTLMDEMLVQDDEFTTQVMADDLVKMSEMNSSASADSDKADEGSSFLTDAEFTTQLPDYLFTDEVESTTLTELVTQDSTESATETATDPPMASSEMPQPVHHLKRPLNKKKRSYEGYRVYRVILPTEESVQRILALEGEPGIDFWADPHLLLRPRGLFVTSAADIMASPKAIPLVEEVFRRSRLPFVVMVDNVQVKMASAVSWFRGKTLTFDVFVFCCCTAEIARPETDFARESQSGHDQERFAHSARPFVDMATLSPSRRYVDEQMDDGRLSAHLLFCFCFSRYLQLRGSFERNASRSGQRDSHRQE